MNRKILIQTTAAALVGAMVTLAVCRHLRHTSQIAKRTQRLQHATSEAKANMRTSVPDDVFTALYSVLKTSTLNTLAVPRIYRTIVLMKANGERWIVVWWVEENPSPEGLRLISGDITEDIFITPLHLAYNLQEAEHGALTFNAGWQLKPGDPGYDLLDNHEPVTVQLTRRMQAISKPVELVYSKEIKPKDEE